MMQSEEVPRGMPYQQGRNSHQPNKYQDNRYSPSANYNYNYNGANGGYPSQQQHQRKRFDRFKRDAPGNSNDRLMRQNDLIIRILKEIRDRLPPPLVSASVNNGDAEAARQNGRSEEEAAARAEAPVMEAQEPAAPGTNGAAAAMSADSGPLQPEPEQPPPEAVATSE